MAYTKTNWATAKISASNLNKAQQQYDEAVIDMWDARTNTTKEIRAFIVEDFPAHKAGLLIFHNGYKRFFMSNGSKWLSQTRDTMFGDGSGGDLDSTGNITISNTIGSTVIVNYSSFRLNSGHTLTTQNPCRCLLIRSWGDIIIDGTLDLGKKGGFGERYITIGGVQYDLLGGDGGNGGSGGCNPDIPNGGDEDAAQDCAGGRRGGGGGGGGTRQYKNTGGKGGRKNTAFSVTGTGGTYHYVVAPDNNDNPLAEEAGFPGTNGAGGSGATRLWNDPEWGTKLAVAQTGAHCGVGQASGGGTGGVEGYNPVDSLHGSEAFDPPFETGGGAIILVAFGNITINGSIKAEGGRGGQGRRATSTVSTGAGGGGGGGGAGGGKIVLLHRGSYTNNGSIDVNGGAGRIGGNGANDENGFTGSNGSSGSVQSKQV